MASDPYIGTVTMFGGTFAPVNYTFCAGQIIAISDNTALYSIIGSTYGGDGRSTMGIPELRGRVPIGQGSGPALTPRFLGQMSGLESNTLGLAQMPTHNHSAVSELPQTACTASGTAISEAGLDATYSATSDFQVNQSPGVVGTPSPGHRIGEASGGVQIYNNIPASVTLGPGMVSTSVTPLTPPTITTTVSVTATVPQTAVNTVVNDAGDGAPFSNMQPFNVLNYIMAIDGIYPPRN